MYVALGLSRGADALSVRRGYRERVRTLRSDASNEHESDDLIRELTHAYAVLSKPASRLLYDRVAVGRPLMRAEHEPGRELATVRDNELVAWILGAEPHQNGRATSAAPAQDRMVRYVATVGFVIALVFLVALLLHA
jgi:curved DNA-binding protein CbpA